MRSTVFAPRHCTCRPYTYTVALPPPSLSLPSSGHHFQASSAALEVDGSKKEGPQTQLSLLAALIASSVAVGLDSWKKVGLRTAAGWAWSGSVMGAVEHVDRAGRCTCARHLSAVLPVRAMSTGCSLCMCGAEPSLLYCAQQVAAENCGVRTTGRSVALHEVIKKREAAFPGMAQNPSCLSGGSGELRCSWAVQELQGDPWLLLKSARNRKLHFLECPGTQLS
ncbi:uncharacterized protein LOC110391369 isoform X2 [Numida meleagris]|uniref:uncharacterized protein LOC110391369 isoform X2 n=1 Tax=Numida meleagris TaxID=8996 RepID=UPI000B3DF3FD|nr:uncharacterized protein LOC110391369 isoform X2 [Numida meleagris]